LASLICEASYYSPKVGQIFNGGLVSRTLQNYFESQTRLNMIQRVHKITSKRTRPHSGVTYRNSLQASIIKIKVCLGPSWRAFISCTWNNHELQERRLHNQTRDLVKYHVRFHDKKNKSINAWNHSYETLSWAAPRHPCHDLVHFCPFSREYH